MNSSSHQHIRPIHHSFLNPSLSSSEKKYELNKKMLHPDQTTNAQLKLAKQDESPLSIFSKKLEMSLKQLHNDNENGLKLRKNIFFKDEQVKIKQTKKILIIQQKLKRQTGFTLNMLAAKSEERLKNKLSQKKRSFVQRSVQKIPLICYPVDRVIGFRKKVAGFLENQEAKNISGFQHNYKRKSFRKRSKIQLLQSKLQLKIETEPGDLGRVCFVVPSNLEEIQKKISKKVNSIYQASQAYKQVTFRKLSKYQEKDSNQKGWLNANRQKDLIEVGKHKQSQISPWNEEASNKYF